MVGVEASAGEGGIGALAQGGGITGGNAQFFQCYVQGVLVFVLITDSAQGVLDNLCLYPR